MKNLSKASISVGTSNLDETRQNAFSVWLKNTRRSVDEENIIDLISSFDQDYIGVYKDKEDYAYEYIEENYDLPWHIKRCFDYEKYADEMLFVDGFVFYD